VSVKESSPWSLTQLTDRRTVMRRAVLCDEPRVVRDDELVAALVMNQATAPSSKPRRERCASRRRADRPEWANADRQAIVGSSAIRHAISLVSKSITGGSEPGDLSRGDGPRRVRRRPTYGTERMDYLAGLLIVREPCIRRRLPR